ncbi:hypothetical protein [Streptomyces sp. NPDC046385]
MGAVIAGAAVLFTLGYDGLYVVAALLTLLGAASVAGIKGVR